MEKTGEQTNQTDEDFTSDEFVSLAREHFLNDYPNPMRVGCPSQKDLNKIAQSKALPDDALRRHLLGCSPCLKEFRSLRENQSAVAPARKKFFGFNFFLQPAFAAAIVLIAGLLGAAIYFTARQSNVEVVNQNQSAAPKNENEIAVANPEDFSKPPTETDLPENLSGGKDSNKTDNRKAAGSVSKKPENDSANREILLAKNTIKSTLR